MMPGFFANMPKPQAGKWVACVIMTSPFRKPCEIKAIEVDGLWKAYVLSRLMALWADITLPYCDGELGVDWGIRKVKENPNGADQAIQAKN